MSLSTAERFQRLFIEVCPLKLGDLVRTSPQFKFAGEWPGLYIVTGMRWDYQRHGHKINIAIASEDEILARDGDTDGFSPSDLIFVSRDSRPVPPSSSRER